MIVLVVGIGIVAGIMAGLLGVGGGILLVPALVALGLPPVNATATSTIAMLFSSVSGTFKNYRDGEIQVRRVLALSIPSTLAAQLGVLLAHRLEPHILLFCFAIFLLINIYLFYLRRNLKVTEINAADSVSPNFIHYIFAGILSGFMAGLFGIGGGIILVPILVILFRESLKGAARISLAVIMLTALSAFIGYAFHEKVYYREGVLLGVGGLIGAQIGTRLLKRFSDKTITIFFQILMLALAVYMVWSGMRFLK